MSIIFYLPPQKLYNQFSSVGIVVEAVSDLMASVASAFTFSVN